jgi:RNA polymerase sigma factor (sigma-70 family)
MPRRFPFHLLSRLPPAGDHVPDADLLRRFVRDRDPAALELVVRRHADAVWAACRRVSRSEADAEDAFQATFLVLARKAGSVRGACAGGWLHRVAVNAALKVRVRERRGVSPTVETEHRLADAPTLAEQDELAAVVQEELARLPDRYRLPVVLCDLEGQTHAEAAAALRWPVGSVSGRLSRARGLLRDRLARRGYGAAPLVLAPAGGLPPRLIPATTAALSGAVPVPPSVSLVAEGVLSAMRTAKLQLTAAVMASAGLLGLAGVGAYTVLGQERPPAKKATEPPAPPPKLEAADDPPAVRPIDRSQVKGAIWADARPGDSEDVRLLKEQWNQGVEQFVRTWTQIDLGAFGSADYPATYECLTDLRRIAAELWGGDRKRLVAGLELLLGFERELERFTRARVLAGTDRAQALNLAKRHRLAAEAALWKAKNPRPAAPGGGPGR